MNAVDVLRAQLTRDLFAIAKFLLCSFYESITLCYIYTDLFFLMRDATQTRHHVVSVCPSVTFVDSVETNKHIVKKCSPPCIATSF